MSFINAQPAVTSSNRLHAILEQIMQANHPIDPAQEKEIRELARRVFRSSRENEPLPFLLYNLNKCVRDGLIMADQGLQIYEYPTGLRIKYIASRTLTARADIPKGTREEMIAKIQSIITATHANKMYVDEKETAPILNRQAFAQALKGDDPIVKALTKALNQNKQFQRIIAEAACLIEAAPVEFEQRSKENITFMIKHHPDEHKPRAKL